MRNFQKRKKRVLRRYIKKRVEKAKEDINKNFIKKNVTIKVEMPRKINKNDVKNRLLSSIKKNLS
ncbi:hypothetical protein [Ilyobacter polytropus]|uniref:Uncharacterized protein n=1 Tax=Ilyobacter polytropus (strain ATCC 51220 / DSM 2926 / LMG 16218 / CuHBu1) TaxID=572544 RepID=E3HBS5_ILYPC|nr:hypothetical protein [Ilyobacter polytropus]ADO83837.1 conserved hypothetical protein [Ilyobacter polytropus DSM 2926]